jgi:hypothetical protein
MRPEQLRLALVVGMLMSAGLLITNPLDPKMNTEVIFDDEAVIRIKEESVDGNSYQLVLRFRHDDGAMITNNLSRVQDLMQLEREFSDGTNPDTAWTYEELDIKRIVTPFSAWSDAFESRNRSLVNATQWANILLPEIEDGWCGSESNTEELTAFEATLLMLPEGANFGIACPAFAGASATQPPAANEILWLIDVNSTDEEEGDWDELRIWADRVSENSDYEISAVGVNMMYGKAKALAEDDLQFVVVASFLVLGTMLTIGLRDWQSALATLGGVGLVIGAEFGLLSALGFELSIIDGIALPIIMGVAVDGAFWYSRSSRNRDEVRSMLFIAMVTTVAAVSLAIFSPIRAQRSLGLVMAIGIFLDWVVTRYVLEDFFLARRKIRDDSGFIDGEISGFNVGWSWPVALLVLASIAVMSPPGVNVLEVEQFLPADDPALDEMEDLQSKYVLASSTIAWVVVDVDGGSDADYIALQNLQQQLGQHPSVISLETGLLQTPMVNGVPQVENASTIDAAADLSRDGENSMAAMQFAEDAEWLIEENGLTGITGGDLPTGARAAETFEESRVTQILFAGIAIFIVALFVVRTPLQAARIAVGAIAIGAAVDGLASSFGGRGVNTALAVLLGMGFAADYLAHSSAEHAPTKLDMSARWWAALSSASVFILLATTTFPPAKNSGQLLSLSIVLSVILATCLAFTHLPANRE